MRFLLPTLLLAGTLGWHTGGVETAAAWPSPDPPRGYELRSGSLYQEGCFAPCLCPILDTRPVEGGFALREIEPAGDTRHFELSNAAWLIRMYDGSERQVRGDGQYWFDPVAGTQQMTLDLRIDDREIEHFDSRVLEKAVVWPAIDVVVTVNDFFCFDIVFELKATPTGTVGVTERSRWGVVKWSYRD